MKNNRFFQVCFCVGFISASYYSYGAVKSWLSPESPATLNHTSSHGSTTDFNQLNEAQKQALSASQHSSSPVAKVVTTVTGELVPTEAPLVSMPPLADAAASPADPSANPSENAENAEGTGEIAANPELQPYFPQPYSPQFSQNESSEQESKHSGMSESRDPSSLTSISPAFTSTSANSAAVLTTGSVSHASSGNQSYPFASLSGSDLQALSTEMKGSFPAGTDTTSGTLCQVVQPVCSYESQYSVNSRSWAMQKVLEENVNFGVQHSGQSLAFNIGFKVLTNSNVEENVSVHAVPSSVNPHREFVNSTHYRVLDFNFPNMQIHGEPVKNVRASLVYEETPAGLELTNQSKFTFERNDVAVDAASSTDYFTAEELKFSIKVEKLL